MTTTKIQVIPGIYIEPHIARTAKGDIEYDLTEGDSPVVLSIHAGLGGADQGRLIANWLGDRGYRILSPSRPGYLGTPLDSGRTIKEQADLLVALLDTLGINKVALFSLSAGGPIAYTLAAWHSKRVLAMIAVSSVSGYYEMPETVGQVGEAIFMSIPGQKLMRLFMNKLPGAFLTSALAGIGYLPKSDRKAYVDHVLASPDGLAFMKGLMDTMYPYSLRTAGNKNDMQQFRALKPLPFDKITCPSLIIHGTLDADVKFYDGVRAYEHIKGAERYWIEGGDHLAFWLSLAASKAQAFALAFLERHTRS